MDNKFNNMLNNFLENLEFENEEDINKKLEEFMNKYNNEEIEYEDTLLDKAYKKLEEAENASSKSKAIKLAKEAYDMCNECFDAILFQVDLEDNTSKRDKLLDEGLELERKRLEKEGYFDKDSIGRFYGIYETRPYLRGLYNKADCLIYDGKAKQARDICLEILRLNNNDNMGIRYLLMAIYAYLEDEDELLKLYKKYPEENLGMLFPQFVIYYKLGNDKKALELLDRINKANPNFIKFFKGTIKANKEVPFGCYSQGDSSEVLMYLEEYCFLLLSMPHIHEYILEHSKKKKK